MRATSMVLASVVWLPYTSAVHEAQAGFFGPSNYEECILQSMRGVTSDVAARSIRMACRIQFPVEVKKCVGVNLTHEQLSKLDGRAYSSFGSFIIDIYNGNESVAVGSIDLVFKDKGTDQAKNYKAEFLPSPVEPLSQSSLHLSVMLPDEWTWSINGAVGCAR
jgi:hypothetical protein